jgi:hypothetical protein
VKSVFGSPAILSVINSLKRTRSFAPPPFDGFAFVGSLLFSRVKVLNF